MVLLYIYSKYLDSFKMLSKVVAEDILIFFFLLLLLFSEKIKLGISYEPSAR